MMGNVVCIYICILSITTKISDKKYHRTRSNSCFPYQKVLDLDYGIILFFSDDCLVIPDFLRCNPGLHGCLFSVSG